MSITLGYVISGHGFGHATRAIAVMQALEQRLNLRFVILTSAPPWLFNNALSAKHVVHPLETDVGLVQHSALSEDIAASLEGLRRFYPLREEHIQKAATLLKDCALIISDIAPLGLEAARYLHIPSILVENFTWDWIYAPFEQATPALVELSQRVGELFLKADYRIQTQPVCVPKTCDLVAAPVARRLRAPEQIRQSLHCTPAHPAAGAYHHGRHRRAEKRGYATGSTQKTRRYCLCPGRPEPKRRVPGKSSVSCPRE